MTWHPQAEKLYRNILPYGNPDTAAAIAYGVDLAPDADAKAIACWVKDVCARLEAAFDEATIKAIRMGCYCTLNMEKCREWIAKLFAESADFESFVAKMNELAGGWYLKDSALCTTYYCSCPMLQNVDLLPRKTWCYCTVGYTKALLGRIFNCAIDVEVVESIKMGGDKCVMKITFHDKASTD